MTAPASSRRDFLKLGPLCFSGLLLPDWLRVQAGSPPKSALKPRAKACLYILLQGGPSQLDCWDPKPDAAPEYRGEFRPISTRVPGTLLCEHLPRLASMTNRYALLRACTHDDTEHNSAVHACLTGRMHPQKGQIVAPSADDFPPYGAAAAKLRPASHLVPGWITMPATLLNTGIPFPSQNAGFLGGAFDPLAIRSDPNSPDFAVQGLSLPLDISGERLEERQTLLRQMNLKDERSPAPCVRTMDRSVERAFDLIQSPAIRAAFSLTREADRVRDRYGRSPFGQSLLLARRLLEAGVPMLSVYYTNEKPRRPGCAISWDTHEDNFRDLKTKLLPDLDRSLSALLEDLEQRGLLADTLVIAAGEFGRTPKINTDAGRDHWTRAYSALWAGAGVRGGLVYGASDRNAAEPIDNPATPADLAATLYWALGIDHQAELHDRHGRPHALTLGTPLVDLFA